ncbi:MAG: DUF551 domain-containing protein [Flavobacteriales bacterium]|nr:DUF551 domain-containing protein [Flavobacteriales bacterium]
MNPFEWIDINDRLPEDGQRLLAFIPNNKVYLPGLQDTEIRDVVVLRFCRDFYPEGSEKREKHGAHFWQGEGNSNHFFPDVTHWAPIPEGPSLT